MTEDYLLSTRAILAGEYRRMKTKFSTRSDETLERYLRRFETTPEPTTLIEHVAFLFDCERVIHTYAAQAVLKERRESGFKDGYLQKICPEFYGQ